MILLDLPGCSGEDGLEVISRDWWFEACEESELARLVQERSQDGEPSNFDELGERASVTA